MSLSSGSQNSYHSILLISEMRHFYMEIVWEIFNKVIKFHEKFIKKHWNETFLSETETRDIICKMMTGDVLYPFLSLSISSQLVFFIYLAFAARCSALKLFSDLFLYFRLKWYTKTNHITAPSPANAIKEMKGLRHV